MCLCLLLPCLEPSTERRRTPTYIHTESSSTSSSSTRSSSVETKGKRMTNGQKQIERTRRHPTSSSYVVIPSGGPTPFLISSDLRCFLRSPHMLFSAQRPPLTCSIIPNPRPS
jgi:hypothetical protein